MFKKNVVEEIKVHVMCSVFFWGGGNRAVYEIMWESIVEWTGYNMAHAH